MAEIFTNIRTALNRMSGRQKLQLGLALLATVGIIWGISNYATRIRYGVLFSNLAPADSGTVVDALKKQQVPYRLSAGGTIIEVPVERVDELRMEMAGENLPPGGGVGFEIFDKPAFGMSDFIQNINYRRALEKELARTIETLDNVDKARVHVALPSEAVFADEQKEATASVVLRLRSAGGLTSNQVQAIANLVSSGVEGLQPQHVSIIDGAGKLLSVMNEDDDSALSAGQMDAKKALEHNLEKTLVGILEPVVGKGRVRARASVDLNMKRIQRVMEEYDPDAVLRSEVKTKSEQTGGAPGGAPGTASNLPGGSAPASAGNSSKNKTQSTTSNFEISKTVSTINEPVGAILRQSVAVVVDNAPSEADGASGGSAGGEGGTGTPRTPEEMKKITDLVRAAVGIDDDRGDTLIVENVPFDDSLIDLPEESSGFPWAFILQIVRYSMLPMAVLLLALLVIRPAIAALRPAGPALEGEEFANGPPTIAEMQAKLAGLGRGDGHGNVLRQKLIEAATQDPQAAAAIMKNWLEVKRGA